MRYLALPCACALAFALALPALAQTAPATRPIVRDNVLKRAGAQFDKLDTNKDGLLDKVEMDAAIEDAVNKLRARMQQRYAEADANKDGSISREEFVAARGGWFSGVDTNADGIIDANEMRVYNSERFKKARQGGGTP